MIIDTSVVLSILFAEDRAEDAAKLLAQNSGNLHMSAVNVAETLIRINSQVPKPRLKRTLDVFREMSITTIIVDFAVAGIASKARIDYPALNFGDCFAYATAKIHVMPLATFDADFSGLDLEIVGLM